MFSWLLTLTLLLAVAQVNPATAVEDYFLGENFSLPISASFSNEVFSAENVEPQIKNANRLGIEISSESAIAIDWKTGKVLYSKNADIVRPIASITKLMTALVVLESGVSLEDEITIISADSRSGGIPYVIPGEKILIRDLLHTSLIASANGATVSLSRSTGLDIDSFAERMNQKAIELGMKNTRFVEPTGLDAGNMSTAKDVAILAKYAFDNEIIKNIITKSYYSYDALTGLNHRVASTYMMPHSWITQSPFVFLGGKTGYLQEAGYCFTSAVENENGNRVVTVILNAPSKQARFDEASALSYWVFDAYNW